MQRRSFLAGACTWLGAGPALAAQSTLRDIAREAYVYVSPLVEVASVRAAFLSRGGRAGEFSGPARLASPASRAITTPNNDTLTAQTFIDLTPGPARFVIPPPKGRFASLALMDMFTNNFAVLDSRDYPSGGEVVLVGPRSPAPGGARRAPTPWVWALVRVLVGGPDDLSAGLAARSGYAINAARPGPAGSGAARAAPWQDYFATASALLAENPPLLGDAEILARIAPLGLTPGRFDARRFDEASAGEIAEGVAEARALLRRPAASRRLTGAWIREAPDTGEFGQDYETRARVALGGLGALPVSEAIYMRALDPGGSARFTGDGPWRLTFPGGGTPPVDGFWSLTMYEVTREGQYFLTANPIDRYSIGDRTPNLARDADGGLTIWISRAEPGGDRRKNWLPAPAAGPFGLILRAYLPRPQFLSGVDYIPPPVTRA
jgi:hypothetical protein